MAPWRRQPCVRASEMIAHLPQGYDTVLGKWFVNSAELSGGEWQRIALDRAYVRRSPIILLDEPTSFMDSWAETDWFKRFRELAEGRTGIIITHRFTIALRTSFMSCMGARLLNQAAIRNSRRVMVSMPSPGMPKYKPPIPAC